MKSTFTDPGGNWSMTPEERERLLRKINEE